MEIKKIVKNPQKNEEEKEMKKKKKRGVGVS